MTVRLGIIGAGAIAHAHVAAAAELPGEVVLTAVCDPRADAARAMTAGLPTATAFPDHRALLGSGQVDAVVIATPHYLHAQQALAAIEAGVAVLVEKPLVSSIAQLADLARAAADRRAIVVAGQMQRFARSSMLARAWLDADPGRFGSLRSFDGHAWQDITEYTGATAADHWLLDGERAGGGVVTSLLIHQLDLVRYLGGADYAEVTALGRWDPPFHHGAESSAQILVRMGNGATGTFHASYLAPRSYSSESLTLIGAHGALTHRLGEGWYPMRWSPTHERREVELRDPSAPEFVDLGLPPLSTSPFTNQLAHFVRAVRGEVPARNTIAENANTIAAIAAIGASMAAGGTTVTVAGPDEARVGADEPGPMAQPAEATAATRGTAAKPRVRSDS